MLALFAAWRTMALQKEVHNVLRNPCFIAPLLVSRLSERPLSLKSPGGTGRVAGTLRSEELWSLFPFPVPRSMGGAARPTLGLVVQSSAQLASQELPLCIQGASIPGHRLLRNR